MNHPEIDWIERTGYPSYAQDDDKMLCDECGRDISYEDQYEDVTHDTLCKHCLLMLHQKG